jgi:hypothetical protein
MQKSHLASCNPGLQSGDKGLPPIPSRIYPATASMNVIQLCESKPIKLSPGCALRNSGLPHKLSKNLVFGLRVEVLNKSSSNPKVTNFLKQIFVYGKNYPVVFQPNDLKGHG